MSPKTKSLSLDEQRSRLERRANVIRSRLLRTIDALDNRRHQVQELGHHAKRLAAPAFASLLGMVVITAGVALAVRAFVEHRRQRHLNYRIEKALAPFRREVKPPFWQEALRKVALTALGILASELTKRGTHVLLVRRSPVGLLPSHVEGLAPPATTAQSAPLLGK